MCDKLTQLADISIHALREDGDSSISKLRQRIILFLSTPSARRATAGKVELLHFPGISIHALREEGDGKMCNFKRA